MYEIRKILGIWPVHERDPVVGLARDRYVLSFKISQRVSLETPYPTDLAANLFLVPIAVAGLIGQTGLAR